GTHRVSPWLVDCLRIAREITGLSDGAWCATMLPLVRLWRQAARDGAEPTTQALTAALATCAPDAWDLDGDSLQVHAPDLAFDLGGLAKGFAVDLVVAGLRSRGIDDLLVQVGGETACHGRSSSGDPHRIGIPHPDDPDGSWNAVLSDPGTGLCGSTSGDYRQGVVVAGETHHHVIDPRTGRAAASRISSVTCVFTGLGRNAFADGLSTAATVIGVQGLSVLRAATGCEGCTLRRDPQRGMLATVTPGWDALLADDRTG
ncbi:MAG: FAD:protein FMN transferase, partial [Planctomycetes bacterium]|nr:FAD:protein FMN transferase [Planctomycetota bacterium]